MAKQMLQYITSEDLSRQPDQAAFKINRLIEAVNELLNQ